MEHSKQGLAKKLSIYEQGAYDGAVAFYYCFIPTAMVVIFFGNLSMLEDYMRREGSSDQLFSGTEIGYTFGMILASWVSFYYAVGYYRICNKIDVTPILSMSTIGENSSEKINIDDGESDVLGSSTKP